MNIKKTSLFLTLFASSCSYVIPEAENPNPGLEKSSTAFQVKDGILSLKKWVIGYEINQKTNSIKNTRKTWLCGWAPVTQSGRWHGDHGLLGTPYRSRHCNMEFRISRNGKNLEARTINLNFPDDYKRWPLLFTIPIKQHFFYERPVDVRGRELNKYKKVTDRKNWQLAPIMDIDLQRIDFHDPLRQPHSAGYPSSPGGHITDIFEIEISKEKDKQFIAFNGTFVHDRVGSMIQHVYRFNFLEIKENPNFVKTPYDPRDARHMNLLHILGHRPNGFEQVNYAAHWDISSPVEFCLNGFPDDNRHYKKIPVDVIEELNKSMVRIGAIKKDQKAFIVSKRKPKYHFDLRCPSITWVDDAILSLLAPLGIGSVNTNIKTGEILWGGAVIWGGLIDRIINRYSESVTAEMLNNTYEMILSSENSHPYFENIQGHIDMQSMANGLKSFEDIVTPDNSFFDISEALLSLKNRQNTVNASFENFYGDPLAYKNIKEKKEALDKTIFDLRYFSEANNLNSNGVITFSFDDDDLVFDNIYRPKNARDYIQDLISWTGPDNSLFEEEERHKRKSLGLKSRNEKSVRRIIQDQLDRKHTPFDADNIMENYYDDISAAIDNMNSIKRLEATQSFIKNLILHECGHIIGLGHQFAANQMPEKGTVPPPIYNQLAAEVPRFHNYTSIMDYMNGRTQVSLPYEKVKMQIQDELTLAYLYKQEYSTYKAGDRSFTFFKVPANGIIPGQTIKGGLAYTTRYMPQCSDLEALLATNPYCRRWDRGHNAPAMVEENFKQYTDSFIQQMNSFTEASGGYPQLAEYRLKRRTYNLMNFNRTFYDNMRYELAKNDVYRSVFDKLKKDEDALLSFSKACIDPGLAPNDKWGVEFTKLAIQPLMSEMGVVDLKALQKKQRHLFDDDDLYYENIYNRYKDLVSSEKRSTHFDDEYMDRIEARLNEDGLAFSELQRLCRASKNSLDVTKFLLSLEGEDHTVMNYETAVVPTGFRGGEAFRDYSRLLGTYEQLGLLPIKFSSLDVFTNTSSTMRLWFGRIRKPKFQDPHDGKTGYFSMYPKEFTDIISTAIKNNMKFGGSQLQDAANMSIANLSMHYFLSRTFSGSNDNQARGFNANYMSNLRTQTEFQIFLTPVILTSIKIEGKDTNRWFGFQAKAYNRAKREFLDLPPSYALPDRRVILAGNDSQIILPLTKIRFTSQDSAYVWAVEVSYDKNSYDDPLQGFTVKNILSESSTHELAKCIEGPTGLASFFNSNEENEEFIGFHVDPRIATDLDAQTNFEKSLNEAFDTYHNRKGLIPSQSGCEESVKGIGLIVATALSLNGLFFPQMNEYIQK